MLLHAVEVDRVALDNGEDERREYRLKSTSIGGCSYATGTDAVSPKRGLGANTAGRARGLAIKQKTVMVIDAGDGDHISVVGHDVGADGVVVWIARDAEHVDSITWREHHVRSHSAADLRSTIRRRRLRRVLRTAIGLRNDVAV